MPGALQGEGPRSIQVDVASACAIQSLAGRWNACQIRTGGPAPQCGGDRCCNGGERTYIHDTPRRMGTDLLIQHPQIEAGEEFLANSQQPAARTTLICRDVFNAGGFCTSRLGKA